MRDTFHRFAADKIRPVAEHIHRENADIPEDIISGMAELGGFGLSVPEEYGGFAAGGESDYLAMCVATEELSWGSLGAGGALITRPGDPHPRHREGRDRGAEARLAPPDRERRARRRRDGHRARLRLGRRRREGHRHRDRRRLPAHGREDLVHVRGAGGHAHGARPHRPGPQPRPPWALGVRRRQAAGSRPPLLVRRRPRREDGGPRDRHPRLPRHALLRGRVRQLVRARGQPHRPRERAGQGLLPPDGGLRERPAPDRGPCRRRHAGRVRGRARVRAGAHGLRQAGVRLPAVEGEARAHGRAHLRRAASSPTTWPARWRGAKVRSRPAW